MSQPPGDDEDDEDLPEHLRVEFDELDRRYREILEDPRK